MPLAPQQRDEFLDAGFMRVDMGFSQETLARMRQLSSGFVYIDTTGGARRYRMHDLVSRGTITNPSSPLAMEFLDLCQQVCAREIFADVLGVEPHELAIPDIFLIRMSPGDEIGMHTHACTI